MKKSLVLMTLLAGSLSEAEYVNISADFEGDTVGVIYEGPKYNYTENIPFLPSFTSMNVLVFRHGSASKYLIETDPLNADNQVFWVNGANNVEKDGGGGMYFMNLDLTGEGAYTSGIVKISYSFRMLRDGMNENSPTGWEITWVTRPETLDDGTENLDAWAWAGEEVIDNFTTSGDESEWVTVEGFFVTDLSNVDTTLPYANGLHVRASNGGWVGGGQGIYYVDDIKVSISQGDEAPTTWAGYEMNAETGDVDTGSFLGWINVLGGEYVWSYSMNSWLYLPEENVSDAGAWTYVPR
jgi:hypothetical protein